MTPAAGSRLGPYEILAYWGLRVRTYDEVDSNDRFLFAVTVDEPDARPIVAVVDWTAGLPK